MAQIYNFKTLGDRDIDAFFKSLADTMEWSTDTVYIAHDKEGNVSVGIISKEPERLEDTYTIGILERAKMSIILGEED